MTAEDIIGGDYPFTRYAENGDIECQTCEKKFFAPGLCDSCFLDLVRENITKAEKAKVIDWIDSEVERLVNNSPSPVSQDAYDSGGVAALQNLRDFITKQ